MKNNRLKKWIAGTVALLFGVSIIGYTIKLTYDTMKLLFPSDPILQYISIALYDGGVIHWLTTYIARAKGTPQRGISLLLTVLDFLGVVSMVIAGIYLSGQTLASIPPWVGGAVVVVTIIAATLNAGGIYYYHANDPVTREEIQAQELEDDLNEEALDQARFAVERKAQELGNILANRVTARMKYRLRLPMTEREYSEWQGETVDAESYDVNSLPPPPVQDETFWSALKSFFGGKQSKRRYAGQPSKSSTPSQPVSLENTNTTWGDRTGAIMAWNETPSGRERLWCLACREDGKEWTTPAPCEHIRMAEEQTQISRADAYRTRQELIAEFQPASQEQYGPEWENSTDITPTLDAYAWVCLNCEEHNQPHTRTCQRCSQPRVNKSPVTAFASNPETPSE